MKFRFIAILMIATKLLFSQTLPFNQKFSANDLKQDVTFLKDQLYNVHAFPFSELSKNGYDSLFNKINESITDSITIKKFYSLVRPTIAHLADEHSRLDFVDLGADYKSKMVFLPFTLKKINQQYVIDSVLIANNSIKKGDTLTNINDKEISIVVGSCSEFTSGFQTQREKMALEKLGIFCFFVLTPSVSYTLTLNNKQMEIQGCNANTWINYLTKNKTPLLNEKEKIVYTKYGSTAYIQAYSFNVSENELPIVKAQIQSIFKKIKQDKITQLIIDVSNNGGGNSVVGSFIIDYLTEKPYKDYQYNWKKSKEYQEFMASIGISNDFYLKAKMGDIIHFDSELIQPSKNNPLRFKGKIFIIIGHKTFSSAIQFATIIKDNHIAQLAGVIPSDGHPSHFGELYKTQLPNTKLGLQFGVKEWIRPIGKNVDNYLVPDIIIDFEKENTSNKIINFLTE